MYNIFLNPSIAAILFGIAAIFLFTQLKNVQNKILTIVIISILIICIACIIYYNSRVVWLSIIFVACLIKIAERKIKFTVIFFIALTSIVALLAISAFYYKQNSTLGRILIYKINFLIVKEHWLTGIQKPYSVVFNHTQANYFLSNPNASIQEKLLAGSNYFVLNEWLNIFIHYGFIAFTLAVLLSIYLVTICIKQLKQFPQKNWAIGIVIFLLLVSLFSYPFSFIPYVFIFGGCILYIFKNTFALPKKVINRIFIILFIGLTTYSSYNIYTYTKVEKEKKAVTDLFRVGYINQALTKALAIQHTQPPSHQVYEQIAAIYLQKNNIDSAIFYIDLAHNFSCNDELHNFWGNCLLQQNKFKEAINQFTLAVNIIPHRFKNRFDLLNAYLLVNDFEQAKKCGSEIISLPEKIPSKKSSLYKQKALLILDTLSR